MQFRLTTFIFLYSENKSKFQKKKKKKKKKKKNLGRKSIMQSMDDYLKKNTALSLQGRGNFINLALI